MAAEKIPQPAAQYLPSGEFPSQRNGIQPLRITVLRHDEAIVVTHLIGGLDILTGPWLQRHLDKALATQPERLIVDLSGVSFLGATGLAVLINAQHAATQQGTRFQLRGVNRAVARSLQATKLAYLFETLPAEEDVTVTLMMCTRLRPWNG
jgi:anti-sigma B factor antagonist